MPTTTGLNVRVHERRVVADGVVAIELRAADGYELSPFTAGSHIDVELPVRDAHGHFIVRQYSLCNDPAEHHRYVIGVGQRREHARRIGLPARRAEGRRHRCTSARRATTSSSTSPRASSVLVAGGIGVTPLLAMARRLSALGRPWTLYYCARTPERAAFLDELEALPGRVIPVFDGVPGGAPIDLRTGHGRRARRRAPVLLRPDDADGSVRARGSTARAQHGPRRMVQAAARFHRLDRQCRGGRRVQVKLAHSGVTLTVPAAEVDSRRAHRGRHRGAVLVLRRRLRHLRDTRARGRSRSPGLGAARRGRRRDRPNHGLRFALLGGLADPRSLVRFRSPDPAAYEHPPMETSMRRSFLRSLTALTGAVAFGLAFGTPALAQETVKVGLLFTYSGPSGMSGQLSDNTIKLFQQKNGATVGGKKIEFVKRDTTGPNPGSREAPGAGADRAREGPDPDRTRLHAERAGGGADGHGSEGADLPDRRGDRRHRRREVAVLRAHLLRDSADRPADGSVGAQERRQEARTCWWPTSGRATTPKRRSPRPSPNSVARWPGRAACRCAARSSRATCSASRTLSRMPCSSSCRSASWVRSS